MSLWCFIKQYQTLIVGGLGFLGVMATIAMNAGLARRQHDRQIHHDARVLRTALRAELEIIRDAFRDRIAMIDEAQSKQQNKGLFVPLNTMTDVYMKVIDRIGLLSVPEVGAVLRAYILIRQMPERLRVLSAKEAADFLYFDSSEVGPVKRMHENYLKDIDRALAVLANP